MKSSNRNVPLLLLQMREAMMTYFRPVLNKHHLTEQQWRILRALYENGHMEPHELCNECCILSPSMAGILKRMEEMSLIVKVPSESDKRRVMVKLAQGVDSMMDEVLEDSRRAYEELKAKVGEQAIKDLIKQIDDMLIKVRE